MPRVADVVVRGLTTGYRWTLDDHVIDLAWSPDGRRLAAAAVSGRIGLFEIDGSVPPMDLRGHAFGTLSLSWSSDGAYLASGGQDGVARIWDGRSGEPLAEAGGGAPWVERVAFSPVDHYLATAAGRKLRLWDAAANLMHEYPDHPSTIADIKWQPKSLFFTTAAYGRLSTYRADSARPVKEFAWKGSILEIAWSPDGNFVATGNQDATVHFWYRKSGKDLEMSGYPSKVRELSWDSTSRFLATGGGPIVTIWDCSGKGPAGTKPIELKAHHGSISALMFQHRGRLLASGGKDGRVCVWDPSRGQRLREGIDMKSAVTGLAWSADDRQLAVGTANGHVAMFLPESS